MSTAPVQIVAEPRASTLTWGCSRRAWYEATGAPRRPVTIDEERWFRRGQGIEDAIVGDLVEQLREENQRPRRQEPVPWPMERPIGIGHSDLFVPADRRMIEVFSTAGSRLEHRKALQVALYTLNHPRASEAFVVSVDPSSYADRWYPVDVAGLQPEVEELERRLVEGLDTGVEPPRVCESPLDAPAYGCPYAEHCFRDTHPEPADVLLDPAAVAAVEDLAAAEEHLRITRQMAREAEGRRDQRRERARTAIPAGEAVRCGAYEVKRTVSHSQRFSLRACLDAGHSLPDEFGAFVSDSESERWTIREVAS